jgi:hypothetical protein
MAALVHIAVGFAAKPIEKRVPVGVAIVATELLDLLAILFAALGIERAGSIPWSHGLLMSAAISAAIAVLALIIYKNYRIGIFIGLLVFSHWVIDFITHPMGAVFGGYPAPPDLPLLLNGSLQVGLGLYNHSLVLAYIIEYASIAIGIGIYVTYKVRNRLRMKRQKTA